MLLYILVIVLSVVFTFLVNAILSVFGASFSVLYALCSVLIYFCILFIMDSVAAFVIHKLPAKIFNPKKRIFKVSETEIKFFDKLNILGWKDKIPDMGVLCNFKKDKIKCFEREYLYKFLTEMCYAEVIHIFMALSGIVVFFICPPAYLLNFALPLFIVNVLLQVPPIMIQRYNRPRLNRIYDISLRIKEKNINTEKVA